ncbi:MAG: MoxR family ATPase [Meiothermus sp.]|uniref:AAA family ATPase n=1 Tax=Meiothermus sp. TaxID=1955249 RepID=UPI00298EDF8B|nr:MoxR family ATPase [Meiothermus sp.]MDW8481310.1 MoxR family ATPase [Meiothermus sp.]
MGLEFLLKRPLLQALESQNGRPPVLLIDELDRADEEFEAFLLEFLSDWQITVPEVGTLRAERPPVVVITSNRTREIHDALKRRCMYYWIDYPSFEKEYRIVREKVVGLPEKLAQQVVAFVQELRKQDLYKAPGVAETLDWAASLLALGQTELNPEAVGETLGALLKYQDDVLKAKDRVRDLLARAQAPTPL